MIGRKGYLKLMFNERVALAVKILCRQINILIQIPFHGNTVLSELTLAYLQIFSFSSHFRIQLARPPKYISWNKPQASISKHRQKTKF